ncbi:hypothetical protein EV368DRAFT_90144 [Lentinula lateritia]|nr:hypothetical protein EV368DRAFT_90144 [Lentinula lateritia]
MPPRHKKPKTQHPLSTATLSTASPTAAPTSAVSRPASSLGDRSHFSDRKFQDLQISSKLRQNIKHQFLTEVQGMVYLWSAIDMMLNSIPRT